MEGIKLFVFLAHILIELEANALWKHEGLMSIGWDRDISHEERERYAE